MDQVMPTTPAPVPVQPVQPAQPEMPVQPTYTTTTPTSSSTPVGMIVGVVVAAVLFLTMGVFALAAANVGKNNIFSQLAAVLPVEKIPGISSLGKSGADLVRDALPSTTGLQLRQAYGGSEWEGAIKIYGNAETTDSQKMGMDLHMNTTTAMNGKGDQMQSSYSMGGTVNYGVVKVDLGEAGVKSDLIMPNANQMFFKLDLSDEVKDMVRPYFAEFEQSLSAVSVGGSMPIQSMDDVFGTYWKLDMQEYMDMMSEMTGQPPMKYDFEKSQAAANKLMLAIGPDLQKVYNTTLGDVSRYATVQDLGRDSVHGKTARVVGLEIMNNNMPPVLVEFVDGATGVVRNHPDAFKQFCEDISTTDDQKAECSDTFSAVNVADIRLRDEDKAEFEQGLRQVMTMVKFTTVKFYISPVDNSLLKYEMVVDASQDALNQLSQQGASVSKAGISIMSAEVSRGKDIVVKAPETYKNFLDVIRGMMAAQMQMLGAPDVHEEDTMTPAFTVPAGSSMTPEQQQQLMQSAQYQKMMQQYGGANGVQY